MVKRKLDGALDGSSADRDFRKPGGTVPSERSGGLHLVEPGLTASSSAVWQTKFGRGLRF